MSNDVEIEVRYNIYRNGRMVGFGTSGPCNTADRAAHLVQTDISRHQWETRGNHPDPDDIP